MRRCRKGRVMEPDSGGQEERGEGEPRPWEQPGQVRRDCEPHRGDLLLVLGTFALVCGLLFWLLWPAVVGFALGFLVLVLGGQDLERMRAGQMDPGGQGQTEAAMTRAGVGLAASLLGGTCCLGMLSDEGRRMVRGLLMWLTW